MQTSKRRFMGQVSSAVMLMGMAAVPAMAQDKAKAEAKEKAKSDSGSYGRKKLFENDKVVVTEVTTRPGGESESRVRNYFRVVRVISGGETEQTYADGKKETFKRKPGDVYAAGPDKVAYKTKNTGKTDLVIYIVQLK
jgi:mannose-6-phosphate isomerase-like protein (cupin superfamily)